MKFKIVLHLISFLILMLGTCMGAVGLVSLLMADPAAAWQGMFWSCGISLALGGALWAGTRVHGELSRREGIGIVVFGWVVAALLSCLPFHLTGAMDNLYDSFFESCSGLTTTGASVMDNLEEHSRAILLWRAVLHLLGGMGILVLMVAIIPYLGVGGMQIYRAEVTGPSKDRLTPRIASTAKLLWGVYILMNIVLVVLLKFGGMNWFDAVCHAFATISTGGFSTRTASIIAYDSLYIEMVITFFMLISGFNFALHFKALRGDPLCYFTDSECRFFLLFVGAAVSIVVFDLVRNDVAGFGEALRHASFYVVSLVTTTGFCTVDYDTWPALSKLTLLTLFVVGGCAGSTAGGLKQIRLSLLAKKTGRVMQSFLKPQAVYSVKSSGQIVPPDILFNVAVFAFVYMATLAAGSLLMSFYCTDLATAISAAFSAIGNVGPGFAVVGPVKNYATVPDGGKTVLAWLMLIGRLEFYTILVVFLPSFWRK